MDLEEYNALYAVLYGSSKKKKKDHCSGLVVGVQITGNQT